MNKPAVIVPFHSPFTFSHFLASLPWNLTWQNWSWKQQWTSKSTMHTNCTFLRRMYSEVNWKKEKGLVLWKNVLKWLKTTTHHLFNMVHHRVNRGVEGVQVLIKIETITSWLNSCWLCIQWQSAAWSDLFSRNFLVYFPFCLVVFIFGSKYK